MKNTKHKITILTDLKGNLDSLLKSTVGLAKMVDAEITVFHVMKPFSVVNQENQLSAMRNINSEYGIMDRKMKASIKSASKDGTVKIDYSLALGNVKDEIGSYIKKQRPDIIVLGKKKSSALSIMGDNIIQYVLKKHDGSVLISGDEVTFESNSNLSLGTLDDLGSTLNLEFSEDLMKHSLEPMKSFKIINTNSSQEETRSSNHVNIVDYVFERNDNTIDKIPDYIEKNNINILFVNRGFKKENNKGNLISSDINGIINKLSFPVMISNNKSIV